MRIERINENKLRVFVSLEDLEDRDIQLDGLNYDTPETQKLFWELMEQAETELGFDTIATNLCVEAMTDASEGFIITITRMDEEGEFESIQKFIKGRYKKKDLVVRKKAAVLVSTVSIYGFSDYDAMSDACMHIQPYHRGSSAAWRCCDQYYLVFYGMDAQQNGYKRFLDILSEYGKVVENTSFFEGYLNEYGIKLIASDAVDLLSGLQ